MAVPAPTGAPLRSATTLAATSGSVEFTAMPIATLHTASTATDDAALAAATHAATPSNSAPAITRREPSRVASRAPSGAPMTEPTT